MTLEATFGNFFKSEIKASGSKLFLQEKISIASGTDTEIQAYVRVSPPVKVRLFSESIGNPAFTATCNCPMAKKSQFCKHIWGVLLATEQRYSDFLSSKTGICKADAVADDEVKSGFQKAAKARASLYRKVQYQKQKLRAKTLKRESSARVSTEEGNGYSEEVKAALAYFLQNGFPMPAGPDVDILGAAKKKLSRVFHPDRGGTHDETVELNTYYDILMQLT